MSVTTLGNKADKIRDIGRQFGQTGFQPQKHSEQIALPDDPKSLNKQIIRVQNPIKWGHLEMFAGKGEEAGPWVVEDEGEKHNKEWVAVDANPAHPVALRQLHNTAAAVKLLLVVDIAVADNKHWQNAGVPLKNSLA